MGITEGQSNINHSIDKAPEADHLTHSEFRRAHDHCPLGVLAIDTNGFITYANNIAQRYTELPATELLGKSFFTLYSDESADKINETKIAQLQEIEDQGFQVINSSVPCWVMVNTKVHRDRDDDVKTYFFMRNISRLKKREGLFAYLNQASAAIAMTRDTASALDVIAQFIVPKFADWFTIDLLKDNRLELTLLKHKDPEKINWAKEYRKNYPADLTSNSGPALVLKTGKPGFVPVVTEQMIDLLITDPVQRAEVKKIGMHSVIIAPIYTKEKITGLVNFISSNEQQHFDESDLEFAQNFANLIGLALENARLHEETLREIEQRKQNEEKFRFLTDAIPHKMWTSGPDGRATYYNQQWYQYTGIEGFEALHEKIWDIIHPDDRAIAAIQWPTAIQTGKEMEMEHRFRRFDGEYRWHLSRFIAHKNNLGEIVIWVGTSTDIHEQKISGLELFDTNEELAAANEELASINEEMLAANEELAAMNEEVTATNEELAATNKELTGTRESLEQSELLFRSIAVNIPKSLIIVIDKHHHYITVEGEMMEKLGYDRQEYQGKHPLEIGKPERYATSKPFYDRVLAGEKFSIERKIENGDCFMVHFVPLRKNDNELYAGLIIALDITNIKQAEEKSAKLAAIVESSDDGIISKTLESVITSWNNSAERMFGYTAEEMIGQKIYKIIPHDRKSEEPMILSRLNKGERVTHFETKRLTKDGRLLDVSITVSPVKDQQGNIIGLSKIARDNTIKKLEEQRKNDFIGMVSHELKTPLTSLNAVIQIAHEKLKKSDDTFLAGAMSRASVQVKRMTAMINGFLNISRLEAGKMAIEKQKFDIRDILVEILEETNLLTKTHKISLIGEGAVLVKADRDKINSVVTNLVNNAIKYSPKGKNIEITYHADHKMVTVAIKDDGMGIKPYDLDKIFDRYYRVESDHSRQISGFGIGLYLSSEIIGRHNGKIWAESEIGKGSTFYFSLPILSDE